MMLNFAIDLGRRAGALLRDGLDRQRTVELKGAFDLVTDMDRASEDLIVSAITAEFPDHAILAEESGAIGEAELTWLIDPLDGTNNYAHGFPYFCVSLGLWRGQTPLLGVIYNPMLDELFSAQAGAGAQPGCAARRRGRAGSGLCRAWTARWALGATPKALGYWCRRAAGVGGRR